MASTSILQESNKRRSRPSISSPTVTGRKSSLASPAANRTPTKKQGVVAFANSKLLKDNNGGVTPPRGRRVSGIPGLPNGGAGAAPLLVVSAKYEEWMKMTTENKINATNTWNLALIDYFHDMSLFRNGDDNSINFQKASCTLDGCVKIWTSRVDSVATETGKLLSGLAEDGRNGNGGDDSGHEDGDDEAQEARAAKRKTARQASTLADDFSKIKVKSLDLEFTVDPLFKKTSADFDEGGAGGILMNHLGCDGNMKVVFDAGDARLDNDDEEEGEEYEEERRLAEAKVDLGKLMSKHLPSFEVLSTMSLCPSLSSFRFSAEGVIDLGIVDPIDEKLPQVNHHLNNVDDDNDAVGGGEGYGGDAEGFAGNENGGAAGGGDVVDFFDDGGGDGGGGGDGYGYGYGYGDEIVGGMEGGSGGGGGGGERDLVLSMDGNGDQMFDYFDSSLTKNWAGPEHWKMRRTLVNKNDDGAATTAKQRKEKVAFSLDFTQPPPISQKELFATGTAAAIKLPASRSRKTSPALSAKSRRSSKPQVREECYILPDDFHFTSQLLLRLFLKPKSVLKVRRRGGAGGGGGPVGDGEADAQFWAAGGGGGGGYGDYDGDMMGGEGYGGEDYGDDHVPFQTQFLHDDDDDEVPDFEEEVDGEPGEADDLLAATQGQLKRVRPENVNYAKRAKRVDVKKLKDSIWKELEEVIIPVKQLPSASGYIPDEEEKTTESLIPVISGLRRMYPKDKMEEISTSFCFICLLHLANEKGLRIQTPQDRDDAIEDGLVAKASVGGLDKLRVFREVTST